MSTSIAKQKQTEHPLNFTDSASYMESAEAFPWREWEQLALVRNVDELTAALGSKLIRLWYQRQWGEDLKAACGWSDSGHAMLWLATSSRFIARALWRHILDSQDVTAEDQAIQPNSPYTVDFLTRWERYIPAGMRYAFLDDLINHADLKTDIATKALRTQLVMGESR